MKGVSDLFFYVYPTISRILVKDWEALDIFQERDFWGYQYERFGPETKKNIQKGEQNPTPREFFLAFKRLRIIKTGNCLMRKTGEILLFHFSRFKE